MIRYAISCLGCKVNSYEAESIRDALNELGYVEVDFKSEADIYCVFTCAVTNIAASKSRKKIHQAIRQNKDAVICVVGCYVQLSADEMAQDEHIDILVGSSHKMDLPKYIQEVLNKKNRIMKIEDVRSHAEFEPLNVKNFSHHVRAYLKIQDGCNQFCSYCVIPYARGVERSLNADEVINQAKELSKHHQEIVLTGIHTGRYNDGETDLAMLIKRMLKETDVARIRISSIESNEITNELIELIKNESRVAKHLHIPLQSGCTDTLRRMNRPYDTEQFASLIHQLREEIPNISISTDLIVGFPSESEDEFNQTKEFLSQMKFSFIHVFPFSSKDKTVAAKLDGHLLNEVKKKRVNEILEYSKQCQIQFESSFIKKKMSVLIEKCVDGVSMGYTSEYIFVKINKQYEVKEMVDVEGSHMIHYELYAKE